MAGHQLKSASITNLDASPLPIMNTIGEGAAGPVTVANDTVTTISGDDTTSTYRLARIPTNAKVKRVIINSGALTAGAGDIDIAFSDSTVDGTNPGFGGGIVQLAGGDNKLFGSAQSLVSIVQKDITFAGTFTAAMQNLPLWQALVNLGATQFSADPGGFFDIFVKITTTITTGGALSVEVDYVE